MYSVIVDVVDERTEAMTVANKQRYIFHRWFSSDYTGTGLTGFGIRVNFNEMKGLHKLLFVIF